MKWVKYDDNPNTQYLEDGNGVWCDGCKVFHGAAQGRVASYVRKRQTFWWAAVHPKDYNTDTEGRRGFKTEEEAKAYVAALARMS